MIIFVAAHDKNYGMGSKGSLPWPLMQSDKEHLHELADGRSLVMGERTYRNYKDIREAFKTDDVTVISKSLSGLPDAKVVDSLEPIIERAKHEDLWVIGGGNIFAQLLPHAQRMYLTEIDGDFEADTDFPKYNLNEWNVVHRESHSKDAQNPYPYTFLTLKRKI